MAALSPKMFLSFLVFFSVLVFYLVAYTSSKKLNQRPNIVFILTDDQDVDLGSMVRVNNTPYEYPSLRCA